MIGDSATQRLAASEASVSSAADPDFLLRDFNMKARAMPPPMAITQRTTMRTMICSNIMAQTIRIGGLARSPVSQGSLWAVHGRATRNRSRGLRNACARIDLGAEVDRSRRGVRPISARITTDLGADYDRSRRWRRRRMITAPTASPATATSPAIHSPKRSMKLKPSFGVA